MTLDMDMTLEVSFKSRSSLIIFVFFNTKYMNKSALGLCEQPLVFAYGEKNNFLCSENTYVATFDLQCGRLIIYKQWLRSNELVSSRQWTPKLYMKGLVYLTNVNFICMPNFCNLLEATTYILSKLLLRKGNKVLWP